jgi:(p)ppGpp synthase/HD superfamily hydrolase
MQSCPNVEANRPREPERWLEADWAEKPGEVYKAALSVVTEQGANLFNQISALLAADSIFTEGILMVPRSDKVGEYSVIVRITGGQQLKSLINKLMAIQGVLYVKRV